MVAINRNIAVASNVGLFGELSTTPTISPSSSPVMFGWQGLSLDTVSGNWDNEARQYAENTGTFTSQDSSGIAGGINLYGSRKNNPLSYVDANGQFATLPFALISGAVGAVVSGASTYAATGDVNKALTSAAIGGASGFVAGLVPIGAGIRAVVAANAAIGAAANIVSQILVKKTSLNDLSYSEAAAAGAVGAGGAFLGEVVTWQAIKSSVTIGGPANVGLTAAQLRGLAAGVEVSVIGAEQVQCP